MSSAGASASRCVPCPTYHTAELAIRRLVARGYSVAVCEQIGDPRLARGLVEREVVRVVSPSAAPARQRRPALGHPDAKTVARRAGASASPPAPGAGTPAPLDRLAGGLSPGVADARAAPSTGAALSTSPRPVVQLPLFNTGEEESPP